MTRCYTYPENFIPKYFILDDLFKKKPLLWILPMSDDSYN